jgi:hypothetical protein
MNQQIIGLNLLKQNAAALAKQRDELRERDSKIEELRGMLVSFLKPYGFILAEESGHFKVLRSDGSPADMQTLFR